MRHSPSAVMWPTNSAKSLTSRKFRKTDAERKNAAWSTGASARPAMIEPAIMIVMGAFVAFVLIALYLPIFSLADTIH